MDNKLDLLLINPGTHEQLYGKLSSYLSGIEPPLWCALIAGYIREKGYKVKIIDAEAENLSPKQTVHKVSEYEPVLTGIIVLGSNPSASSTPKMIATREILTELKKISPQTKTFLGGLHPSAIPERTLLEEDVDFICQGEGFYTVLQLLELLKENIDNRKEVNDYKINGLWYKKDGKIISNSPAQLVKLDDLPFGAWDLLPMDKYRAHNWHCLDNLDNRKNYGIIYTSLGCPYNCSYCLPKGTLILTEDLTYIPIEQVKVGDILIGVIKEDRLISYTRTRVLDIFKRRDRIYKIETMNGSVCSTIEHPWLSDHYRWRKTGDFEPGQFLRKVSVPIRLPEETYDYKLGYIAGAFDGDGSIYQDKYNCARIVGDYEMMDTVLKYSNDLNIGLYEARFDAGDWALDSCIISSKKKVVENINNIINKDRKMLETDKYETDEYKRGYLAGIYDAEGSWPRNSENRWTASANTLRIYNTDERILNRVTEYLNYFGFKTELDIFDDECAIRILGGLSKFLLFFSLVNPKAENKKQQIFDYHVRSKDGYTQILDISPGDICDVYNLETTTGNFIADGFITHNCNIHALYDGRSGIRFRSPEKVVEEIGYLVKNYDIKNLKIFDELFALREAHVSRICDLIIEKGFDLNIWAYARVDTINEEMLKKMKHAGINWLAYGFESASIDVRKGVSKKFNQDKIKKAVDITHTAGINIIGNFIFGLPDDNFDTMQETLKMAKELNLEYINFYTAMAYPGSQLYNIAIENNIKLPETWSGYSQYDPGTLPMPTKYLTGMDVLNFRDSAFQEYFSNPKYLKMVEEKFDKNVVQHIEDMLRCKIRRNH